MKYLLSLILWLLCCSWSYAQIDLKNYVGAWSGELPALDHFKYNFTLSQDTEGHYRLDITGKTIAYSISMDTYQDSLLRGYWENQFTIKVDLRSGQPVGFLQTGHHLHCLVFHRSEANEWTTNWNLFMADDFDPTFYLSLDQLDYGEFVASTFFQSPVCHYMYGQDFQLGDTSFFFQDIRSGLQFEGILADTNRLDLQMSFLQEHLTISMEKLAYAQWKIGEPDVPVRESRPKEIYQGAFSRMVNNIQSGELAGTHSVLIAVNGKTIFEQYFNGFAPLLKHDTRSLSKSFMGALIGIALDRGKLPSVNSPVQPFFNTAYPDLDWSGGKAEITLHHLLTMSSGLDAIDFGLDRMSYANEGAYQNQSDWTEHILQAPMVNPPGSEANYGSGNPHLLGVILDEALGEDVCFFAHRNLFGPLEITDYRIQTDNGDLPYGGGGWYFRPRDLLKFGRLYMQGGIWEGRQLLPKSWVEQSMQKHTILQNTVDQNPYGYLFWHHRYEVNGRLINSIEGRGSGGQYLFMVPELRLVVVITSGNYRNGKGFQPERIMEEYILPELIR